MSQMNIDDSPTSMASLPLARRFKQIQKKKGSPLFCQSSSSSLSSTSSINGGNNKMRMALLNQIKNQQNLNDLPVNFDNVYDYIEESGDNLILPCVEEFENNHSEVYSNTSCMEEEEEFVCDLKANNNDLMRQSNVSMLMSGSTASHVSNIQSNSLGQNNDSSMMMMTSSTCMTAVKSNRKLRLLTGFAQNNFFMDEEDNYFVQLENKINEWLDAEGVLQVEPNSRKMSNSSTISIENPFSTSSLIQRRKLRNLGLF